jgi:hypothetical protein
MNKNELMLSVGRAFSKAGLTLKKHSPEILVVTGVVGAVASAVMACRATTKVSAVVENHKEQLEAIHKAVETPDAQYKDEDGSVHEYTEEVAKRDLVTVYTRTGIDFVKLYGPSVLLGAASVSCILASVNILHKRNAALAAAYTIVDSSFKEYRGRVIERFGKELDRELKYNLKSKEIEIEETVVDEDGNERVEKKTVTATVSEGVKHSAFTRCFDETNPNWTKSAEQNMIFLWQQQAYASRLLREKSWLTINEVYELLGFEPTAAGQVVGWVYDEKNPVGDNYVDFGIFDMSNEQKRLFVNGHERSIWIDFNDDGYIMNYIP